MLFGGKYAWVMRVGETSKSANTADTILGASLLLCEAVLITVFVTGLANILPPEHDAKRAAEATKNRSFFILIVIWAPF